MTSSAGEEECVDGVRGLDELLCTRLGNKEKGFYFLVGCLGRLLEVKTTAVCVPQVQTAARRHIRPGTFVLPFCTERGRIVNIPGEGSQLNGGETH